MNVCPDGCAAAQELARKGRLNLVFAHSACGKDDVFCESGGFVTERAGLHGEVPFGYRLRVLGFYRYQFRV